MSAFRLIAFGRLVRIIDSLDKHGFGPVALLALEMTKSVRKTFTLKYVLGYF